MDELWMLRGAVGGALIGVSASLVLAFNGRVTGISGILNGLMQRADASELGWRALFVVGLVVGGLIAAAFVPGAYSDPAPSFGVAVLAGALVGVGTRLGNGCTSGHGVCGLSRLSVRSLVATVNFIAPGAIARIPARWPARSVPSSARCERRARSARAGVVLHDVSTHHPCPRCARTSPPHSRRGV